MKKYATMDEIAHLWVSGDKSEARTKPDGGEPRYLWHNEPSYTGSRLSFHGDLFYSYATPIGIRLRTPSGKPVYVIDMFTYSNNTTKHQSSLRCAMAHWDSERSAWVDDHANFCVSWGGRGRGVGGATPQNVLDWFISEAKDRIKTAETKHLRFRDDLYVRADVLLTQARMFAKLFKLKTGKLPKVKAAERIAAKAAGDQWKMDCAARRDAARAKRQAEEREWERQQNAEAVARATAILNGQGAEYQQKNPCAWDNFGYNDCLLPPELQEKIQAWRVEQDKVTIAEWLAGNDVRSSERWPTMLRRVGDVIETSRGASFPVEEGRKAFTFVWHLHLKGKEWRRNGEQFAVGSYQLDAVNDQGVVAGCHRITWAEIERFAKLMGWL